MHTVQLLTLAKCPHYSAIEYSHEAPPHECVLTPSPWENRVSPHDLFKIHGTIDGRRVRVLVDDGSTHNFLNYTLVKKLKLPQVKSTHTCHDKGQTSTRRDTIPVYGRARPSAGSGARP